MRIADEPITAIGRFACAISSAALAISSSGATANAAGFVTAAAGSRAGASATSSGRSRCTGPRGSVMARRIASLTVAVIDPFTSGQVALVIGLNSAW